MTCFETGRVWSIPRQKKLSLKWRCWTPLPPPPSPCLSTPWPPQLVQANWQHTICCCMIWSWCTLIYQEIGIRLLDSKNVHQTWRENLVHCVVQKRIGCINDKDYGGIVNMNRLKIMMLKLRKWWVDGDPRRSADRMSATCQPPPSILLLHLHWNAQ